MKINQKGFGAIWALVILFIIVGISSAGWYVYRSNQVSDSDKPHTNQLDTKHESTKLTNEDAIAVSKNFIKGMQDADKNAVDNLTSVAFRTALQAESGTESFYDTCMKGGTGGDSCFASFMAFDLSKVTVDVIDSSKEAGERGKTVTLQANSTLQDKLVNIGYDFHLSPRENSWQIDETQESQGSAH